LEQKQLSLDRLAVHKSAEQLLPWGNFSSALISSLKERGINIVLCQATEKQYQDSLGYLLWHH
jgi:hypothetical protein